METIKLDKLTVLQTVLDLIPARFARGQFVLPISLQEKTLTLCVRDRLDFALLDQLERMLPDYELVLVEPEEHESFSHSLREHYPDAVLKGDIDQAVNLFEYVLRRALNVRASDIHICPHQEGAGIKLRVDGKLRSDRHISLQVASELVTYIKVLSKLDISERRAPQDGNIEVDLDGAGDDGAVGFAQGMRNVPRRDADGNVIPFELGSLGWGETGFDSRSLVFQAIDETVQARIKILNDKGKIDRLATPNLMVADLEASRIFLGDETTILTEVNVTSNTSSGNNPVTTISRDPVTERRDIGTTLVITPKIHADETVTIRIMQENAQVGDQKTIVYGDVDQGDFFVTNNIEKQAITSTVVAKTGEMIALGGLIRSGRTKREVRVPVLASIPLMGSLFRKTAVVDTQTELIVLVRPYVMLTPANAARLSQSFLNRTATHAATRNGSLREGEGNPVFDENVRLRSRKLEETIDILQTPVEF